MINEDNNILPADRPKSAIIGATGFIGSAFFEAYRKSNSDFTATSRRGGPGGLSKLDLLSPDISGLKLSRTGHKDALILAAVAGIDRCEIEPAARKINVDGTRDLIKQLVAEGIKPVFFSSDYVFDGAAGNYPDDAITRPITEYGRQKAEIEAFLKEKAQGNYLIIRLSKVFGLKKGDNTLLDEMAGIMSRDGEVRAAYDQIFCPTLVRDVVGAVARLQARDCRGIYNVCFPEKWSRCDLAQALAQKLSFDVSRIRKVSLDEIGFKARRPKNTSLIPRKLLAEIDFKFTPMAECLERVAENWSKIR
ncbi:MAG: sugar nucleotide-binding protein [Candidatus Margulisbacteria bacterium]|nr:sugar nucleotide-binding protein [Candidatus Margulisiibacteriota bacterium]